MSEEVVRWGDDAQYLSAPIRRNENGKIVPQATLLWATPDPLGAIAAVGRMFKGIPTYDLADITDDERRLYWEETFKSHLRAPHEFVQFHFMIEGVTRSHTHQMVRQRTATFAQESLRFAVKSNLADEVPLPPTIVAGSDMAETWEAALKSVQWFYDELINNGVPAEDARGLLPHAVTTRLHWRTGLNDLLHHAGNRLCTQAQFEWRVLMVSIMKAIREYQPSGFNQDHQHKNSWQFELIGTPTPQTFAPICYQTGKCEFRAIFDRPCSIRDRVDAFERNGVSSEEWWDDLPAVPSREELKGIHYEEWLLNPDAAR